MREIYNEYSSTEHSPYRMDCISCASQFDHSHVGTHMKELLSDS